MKSNRDPRSLMELRRLAYRSRRSEDARAVLLDAILETFPSEFNILVKKGKKDMQAAARRWRHAMAIQNVRYRGERPTNANHETHPLTRPGKTYFERQILVKPHTFELVRRFFAFAPPMSTLKSHPQQRLYYSTRTAASEYLRASPERKAVLLKQENMPLILRGGKSYSPSRWGPIPIYTLRFVISESQSS